MNKPMEEIHKSTKQRYDWVDDFFEGRARVKLNGKWGYIDFDGNEVVPPLYDYVGYYSDGRVCVRVNQKFGFVDLDGNEVVPLRYDYIYDHYDGMAMIRLDGKYGFIDMDGNEVIPCWYNSVGRQSHGFNACFRVSIHVFEHLHFDKDGHLISKPVTR
jgi:hypothetical protein